MKKNLIAVIMIGAVFASLISCRNENKEIIEEGHAEIHTYTCPMHPQIIRNHMATCPICGMDLVLSSRSGDEDHLILGSTQQKLANITVITAGRGSFSTRKELNGRLVTNPESAEYISSRVSGRVEHLYVKETGVQVRKGQPLYQIYSETFASLQQEYIIAYEQVKAFPGNERFAELLKAAEQKLFLYGQSHSQINRLINDKRTSPLVTFTSPVSGVVAELLITEGQYTDEGGSLLRIEKYDEVWVEGDVHPADFKNISKGKQLDLIITGFENHPVKMTIDFISPSLLPGSQLLTIRGVIKNPDNRFQPGMQARIFLPVSSGSASISVPANAVIHEGAGAHVWIQTEPGNFEPRVVKTGNETSGMVEIVEGVDEGENIVASGAYLLYSEFLLKKGKKVH